MDRRVDGWKDGRVGLRIAYSNQKLVLEKTIVWSRIVSKTNESLKTEMGSIIPFISLVSSPKINQE